MCQTYQERRKEAAIDRWSRVCKVCGKKYVNKRRNNDEGNDCCGRECGFIYYAKRKAKAAEARAVQKQLRRMFERIRQCRVCNAAFVAKSTNAIICGDSACAHAIHARDIHKYCKTCGVDLGLPQKGKNRGMHCPQCREENNKLARKRGKWNRERTAKDQTNSQAVTVQQSRESLNLLRQKLKRAGHTCPCCGLAMSRRCDPNSDRAAEYDHKIPLCQGGPDTVDNLRVICRKCNGLKGAFTSPDIVMSQWSKSDE